MTLVSWLHTFHTRTMRSLLSRKALVCVDSDHLRLA